MRLLQSQLGEYDDDGEAWIDDLRTTLRKMGESILESSMEAGQQGSSLGAYGGVIGAVLLPIDYLIGDAMSV